MRAEDGRSLATFTLTQSVVGGRDAQGRRIDDPVDEELFRLSAAVELDGGLKDMEEGVRAALRLHATAEEDDLFKLAFHGGLGYEEAGGGLNITGYGAVTDILEGCDASGLSFGVG